MKYHEQLKHPLWQKKRLEVLNYRHFECENCGSKDDQLHVHHPYYKRGAMVWDYTVNELKCLCDVCHKNEHAIDEKLKKELNITEMSKDHVFGFCSHPLTVPGNLEQATGMLCKLSIPPHGQLEVFILENSLNEVDFLNLLCRRDVGAYQKLCSELRDFAFNRIKEIIGGE